MEVGPSARWAGVGRAFAVTLGSCRVVASGRIRNTLAGASRSPFARNALLECLARGVLQGARRHSRGCLFVRPLAVVFAQRPPRLYLGAVGVVVLHRFRRPFGRHSVPHRVLDCRPRDHRGIVRAEPRRRAFQSQPVPRPDPLHPAPARHAASGRPLVRLALCNSVKFQGLRTRSVAPCCWPRRRSARGIAQAPPWPTARPAPGRTTPALAAAAPRCARSQKTETPPPNPLASV